MKVLFFGVDFLKIHISISEIQWDPSIISTEPTRTDGPSPRRDKILPARLYHSEYVTNACFLVTIDSESVEESFLTSQTKILPLRSLDYIDRADRSRLWSLEENEVMQIKK